jgi:hypothetical protein
MTDEESGPANTDFIQPTALGKAYTCDKCGFVKYRNSRFRYLRFNTLCPVKKCNGRLRLKP